VKEQFIIGLDIVESHMTVGVNQPGHDRGPMSVNDRRTGWSQKAARWSYRHDGVPIDDDIVGCQGSLAGAIDETGISDVDCGHHCLR
jgi:hypothetical protein